VQDAEALQVIYDPSKVTYRQLLEFFYRMHDPTTADRQGPDTGSQYRSGIFYHDEEQAAIAREVTTLVNEKWWKGKVVTQILSAGEWWDAEVYHQKYAFFGLVFVRPLVMREMERALTLGSLYRYLDNNPGGYECPSHFLRSFAPLE
jgi:peptide-methionine (S)-S-oxide reductase